MYGVLKTGVFFIVCQFDLKKEEYLFFLMLHKWGFGGGGAYVAFL